jgi:hypothetical protein
LISTIPCSAKWWVGSIYPTLPYVPLRHKPRLPAHHKLAHHEFPNLVLFLPISAQGLELGSPKIRRSSPSACRALLSVGSSSTDAYAGAVREYASRRYNREVPTAIRPSSVIDMPCARDHHAGYPANYRRTPLAVLTSGDYAFRLSASGTSGWFRARR